MGAVAKRRKLSNPLALTVMVLLAERSMHPYEIAQTLRRRGKEHSVKINFGSLYTVVQNLEKHGYVEVAGVQRQGNRPERTLYGLTGTGRVEMVDWLSDLLAAPPPSTRSSRPRSRCCRYCRRRMWRSCWRPGRRHWSSSPRRSGVSSAS